MQACVPFAAMFEGVKGTGKAILTDEDMISLYYCCFNTTCVCVCVCVCVRPCVRARVSARMYKKSRHLRVSNQDKMLYMYKHTDKYACNMTQIHIHKLRHIYILYI